MKLILAEHRGFCYGVKRAIEIAQSCINATDTLTLKKRTCCTLGPIIHNPQMVERLAKQGITVANTLEDIPNGIVIIRSHGVGPAIYHEAEVRKLEVLDATCPHVKKAQQAAYQLSQGGYDVVVAGERHHPEVKSIVEWAGQHPLVVETVAEAMEVPSMQQLGIVAQTTFDGDLFQAIVDVLKTKCTELKVNRTICTATELRQQAAIVLATQVNSMVVVGGRNSANTTRLAQLCTAAGNKVYHIETAAELIPQWFDGVQTVGITAGASTPDWLIEEVYEKMQEFDKMMTQELIELETGTIVKGKVVSIRQEEVFIDIGYKAEGVITLAELAYPIPSTGSEVVTEGQMIDVFVLDADSAEGSIKLSKVRADKIMAWDKLEQSLTTNQPLEGKVVEVVKGGLVVSVLGVRGFVPASQVDLRFVEDLSSFTGQTLQFIPIEVDQDKQRIVLSRKVLLVEAQNKKEKELFSQLAEGQVIKGTVSRITNFGAFIDIGGIDGLVHISDLAWGRVASPEEVVQVGDAVSVMVLKIDVDAKRISLSLKQMQSDPWNEAITEFSEGMIVKGKVSKIIKFGAFVELKPGVDGLVHISELSEKRVVHVEEVVTIGQEVNVKILEVNLQTKRIGLSIVKAQEEADRADYQDYLGDSTSLGTSIGDKLGHLFKRES